MKSNKQLQSKLSILITFLFLIGALTLTGCGAAPQTQSEAPLSQIKTNVQLDWVHTIDAAQFYVAKAEGYYAEENLDVGILVSGYDAEGNFIDPIEQVTSGKADFGIVDAGFLLSARAEGTPVVAIATVYQRSPVAFVSLAEKNITSPQDLPGTTVQMTPIQQVIYEAMMTALGVDRSQIKEVERTDYSIMPLVNGEADVMDAWVTNEVADLKLQGYEINTILPSEYGIVMYPNVIFTTEALIANNPDLVERFLRATVRGMQAAIDDPNAAATLAVTYDEENLNLEHQTEAMQQSLPLRKPAGTRPGMMDGKVWKSTHQILLDQGILSEPVDVDTAYTLVFLEKVYAKTANK
jgi:NitT/TauT family transport system substrate-binding protein